MKTKTRPWQRDNSIFQYIKKHIDEDGFFTGDNLPRGEYSFINPSIGLELGAGDAFVIMSTDEDDKKIMEVVYKAIKDYLQLPNEKKRDNLYQLVAFTQCVSYCESLAVKLESEENLSDNFMELALEWLYEAPSREAVKFAIVLCGLFGIDELAKGDHTDLKDDLRTLARCDEFTYFVIFAFHLSNIEEELDLWDIIQTTYGWGRVHAMEAAEYDTLEKRDWLLRHGSEIDVHYPAIALRCIKDGNMLSALQKSEIDEELYQGTLHSLNNYMEYLLDLDAENDNLADLAMINTYGLLKEILRHAEKYADSIENLVGIINLSNNLQRLADEGRWETLDANKCHLLISMAEKIIYSKDWLPEIKNKLINSDDSINFLAADFAYALNIDIWDTLAELLYKDPMATKLYEYLLATDNDERYEKILNFARQHLDIYKEDEHDLPPIIKALEIRPGTGEDLLILALTSLYDWPRSCALDVLDAWGTEYLSPEIKAALLKALDMAQHTLLTLRIKSLLDNKVFDLEGAVKIMALE